MSSGMLARYGAGSNSGGMTPVPSLLRSMACEVMESILSRTCVTTPFMTERTTMSAAMPMVMPMMARMAFSPMKRAPLRA